MEQGGFADAARAMNVEHGIRRFRGFQRGMEELKLRRASDEASAAGELQPVGESHYRWGSGVPCGHGLTALRKILKFLMTPGWRLACQGV
jgi:hypothetical protein